MLEQSVPEGLHTLQGTHARAVCEDLLPAGRIRVGEVPGQLSLVEEALPWSRGRM